MLFLQQIATLASDTASSAAAAASAIAPAAVPAAPEPLSLWELCVEGPAEAAEPVDSEPVTYTPAGEIAAAPVEAEPTVSFTA